MRGAEQSKLWELGRQQAAHFVVGRFHFFFVAHFYETIPSFSLLNTITEKLRTASAMDTPKIPGGHDIARWGIR